VGLSFGGLPSQLVVPLEALTAFHDPHIRFGLRFEPEAFEPTPEPAPAPVSTPGALAPAPVPAPEPEPVPAPGPLLPARRAGPSRGPRHAMDGAALVAVRSQPPAPCAGPRDH
jgi:hypothetical protein